MRCHSEIHNLSMCGPALASPGFQLCAPSLIEANNKIPKATTSQKAQKQIHCCWLIQINYCHEGWINELVDFQHFQLTNPYITNAENLLQYFCKIKCLKRQ